jgi:membrane protein
VATKAATTRRRVRRKPLTQWLRDQYALWSRLFDKHELMLCAGAISFKVIVSSITLILLGLGVLGGLGREDVWQQRIAPHVRGRVLPGVYQGISQTVDKIFAHDTSGLIAFACVLAVWQFSGAVRAAMNGISHIYEEDDTRSSLHRFAVSTALAIVIILGLLSAILLVIAAGGAVKGPFEVPFEICRWTFAIVLVGFAFGLLVRYGPQKRRAKRWTSVGATLVVAGWSVEALAFRWYLSSLADFKTAVGSLTILLAVTAYFYIAAIILLVAIELDELLREDAGAAERMIHELF